MWVGKGTGDLLKDLSEFADQENQPVHLPENSK